MHPVEMIPRRRIGRPPAGAREGEKVKDYPQLSIRLPEDVKARLQAMSIVRRRAQWRLISEAIASYLGEWSDDDRHQVEHHTTRLMIPPPQMP